MKPVARKTVMKTRQKVRRGVLIAGLVLFPVTFYWLSPAVPLQGASVGVLAGSLIVFGGLFVQSLLFGRLFCGWACPAGGLQDLTALANGRRVNRRGINWIKYLVWLPWLATVVFLFIRAGGVKRVDPLYLTWHGISVSDWQGAVTALVVLGVLFIPAIAVGRRATCHTLCWMAPFMIAGRWIRVPVQLARAAPRRATGPVHRLRPMHGRLPDEHRGDGPRAARQPRGHGLHPLRIVRRHLPTAGHPLLVLEGEVTS